MAISVLPPTSVAFAQEAPPAAPTQVEAIPVTLSDGGAGIQVNWTDNATNEMGFRIVDQGTGQEYDSLPDPGVGARMSITLPLASGCFRIFAYNNYGTSSLSETACVPTQRGFLSAAGIPALLIGLAALLLAAALTAFLLRTHKRSAAERSH